MQVRPRSDLTPVNTKNQGFRSSITFGPEVTDAEMAAGVTQIERGLAFGKRTATFIHLCQPIIILSSYVSIHHLQRVPLPPEHVG